MLLLSSLVVTAYLQAHNEVVRYIRRVVGDDGKSYYVGIASTDDQVSKVDFPGGGYSTGSRRGTGHYYAVYGPKKTGPFRRSNLQLFRNGDKGEFNLSVNHPAATFREYIYVVPGPRKGSPDIVAICQWGTSNGMDHRLFFVKRGVLTAIKLIDKAGGSYDAYSGGFERKGNRLTSETYSPDSGQTGSKNIFDPNRATLREISYHGGAG